MKEPNPGSDEAIKQGCACPVLDNAHGRGAWGSDGEVFCISAECKLHKVICSAKDTHIIWDALRFMEVRGFDEEAAAIAVFHFRSMLQKYCWECVDRAGFKFDPDWLVKVQMELNKDSRGVPNRIVSFLCGIDTSERMPTVTYRYYREFMDWLEEQPKLSDAERAQIWNRGMCCCGECVE